MPPSDFPFWNYPRRRWVHLRGYMVPSERDRRSYRTQESRRFNKCDCSQCRASSGSHRRREHCYQDHHFDSPTDLRSDARVPRLKEHLCWGCQHQRFDTIPEMLRHLEDGTCDAGWRIQHINALAVECEGSKNYIVSRRLPWLLAGAPPHVTKGGIYDRFKGSFVCQKCKSQFRSKHEFSEHVRTCAEGYPFVLCCPECSTSRFFRISELVQHMETVDCRTNSSTPSRKSLILGLKKKLKYRQELQRLSGIRYELRSHVGKPDEVLVRNTELDEY